MPIPEEPKSESGGAGADAALPRVKIVGIDHPHRGEYGRFTGNVITVCGKSMALVNLEHCRHGTDGCYVSANEIRAVNEDDQYV